MLEPSVGRTKLGKREVKYWHPSPRARIAKCFKCLPPRRDSGRTFLTNKCKPSALAGQLRAKRCECCGMAPIAANLATASSARVCGHAEHAGSFADCG